MNKDKNFNGRITDADRELVKKTHGSVQRALDLWVAMVNSGYMQKAVRQFKKENKDAYKEIMDKKPRGLK